MKKYISLLPFAFLLLWSCEEDPLDYEKNLVVNGVVSGEFYVTEDCGGLYGPYHIYIYNTANSADSVFIENLFDVGGRIKAKVTGNHFSAVQAESETANNNFKFISIDGTVEGHKISYSFEVLISI